MGKLLIVFVIAGIGWYIQNNFDFQSWKNDAMDTMKKEKTINTMNSKRAHDQEDINEVINR